MTELLISILSRTFHILKHYLILQTSQLGRRFIRTICARRTCLFPCTGFFILSTDNYTSISSRTHVFKLELSATTQSVNVIIQHAILHYLIMYDCHYRGICNTKGLGICICPLMRLMSCICLASKRRPFKIIMWFGVVMLEHICEIPLQFGPKCRTILGVWVHEKIGKRISWRSVGRSEGFLTSLVVVEFMLYVLFLLHWEELYPEPSWVSEARIYRRLQYSSWDP